MHVTPIGVTLDGVTELQFSPGKLDRDYKGIVRVAERLQSRPTLSSSVCERGGWREWGYGSDYRMKEPIAGVYTRKETEMTTLTPYLLFDGKSRQAMEFYRSCLGGELILTIVKETPAKARNASSQNATV